MINLKKSVYTALKLAIFFTTFIHAMEQENIDNEGFMKCKSKIREKFNLCSGCPVIEFVKYAIKNLQLLAVFDIMSKQILDEADAYYKSFYNALAYDNILLPEEFCEEFTSDPNKIILMKKCLEESAKFMSIKYGETNYRKALKFQLSNKEHKKKECIKNLGFFHSTSPPFDLHTKKDKQKIILKLTLFFHKQLPYDTFIGAKFRPDSYGYYYLNHVAQRVFINGHLGNPELFCYERHIK